LRESLPDVVKRLEEAINERRPDLNESIDNIQSNVNEEPGAVDMNAQMADLNSNGENLFDKQDRDKYVDMVRIMAHAVSKETTDPRVALLTFKVVEETVKRAYTKAHMNNLMPSEALFTYIKAPEATPAQFEITLNSPLTPRPSDVQPRYQD